MKRVKKYSGELVPFDEEKFRHSLSKSGASKEAVDDIVSSLAMVIYDGIHTKELYRLAHGQLKQRSGSFAARYSLKRALMDLGPSGYHFEKWVAKMFEYLGYRTLTSQHLEGRAVSHEIDVMVWKEQAIGIMECKFRNAKDAKISVTTPMYYLSRLKDLEGLSFSHFGQAASVNTGWLVTNAYFTTDSIRFAEHYGVNILSWDFPEGKNIKNQVDDGGLYPLTCLTTLSSKEKNTLLDGGCILVREILEDENVLKRLGLADGKIRKVWQEAEDLVSRL